MVAWHDTERKNFRSERKSTTVTVTCLINNAVSVNLQLGATVDLLPTIANITGASLPSAVLDGLDLSPLLFHSLSVSEAESMYPNVTCSVCHSVGFHVVVILIQLGTVTCNPGEPMKTP